MGIQSICSGGVYKLVYKTRKGPRSKLSYLAQYIPLPLFLLMVTSWGKVSRIFNPVSFENISHFLKDFIYLFFPERGREGEREKHQCVPAPRHAPNWGPGPQLRHVPWLGIEPATLWFTSPRSVHWATPARVISAIFDYRQKGLLLAKLCFPPFLFLGMLVWA